MSESPQEGNLFLKVRMKAIFIIVWIYAHSQILRYIRRFQDMLEEELDGDYEPLDACMNYPANLLFDVYCSHIFVAVYVTFNLLGKQYEFFQ